MLGELVPQDPDDEPAAVLLERIRAERRQQCRLRGVGVRPRRQHERQFLVAYVDESGDEGFKFLPLEQGSSRWFVLSALVTRKENDLQVVQLARQAREILKKEPKKPLHFRHLKHEQRPAGPADRHSCRFAP